MEPQKQDRALTQRVKQFDESKLKRIVGLLGILGIRRQAKLGPEDYQVFAANLVEFELEDIQAGFEELSKRPREEGETAFPSLGTLLLYIKGARGRRREKEREQAEKSSGLEDAFEAARVKRETEYNLRKLSQKTAMP